MNREIKFRAWDTVNNCWFKQENPQGNPLSKHFLDLNGWLWEEENINSSNSEKNDSLSKKEFILIQYTGLKDNFGKDIYEGDLLKQFNDILTVFWKEGGFSVKKEDGINKGLTLIPSYLIDCEIIGNIYENPELIK